MERHEQMRLDRRLEQRPVVSSGPVAHNIVQVTVLTSSNNKALGYSSLRGCKYTATPVTESAPISTAYDPVTASVAITDDGIAYGTVLLPSGAQSCLITNLTVNGIVSPLTFDLPNGCVFLAYRKVKIPVAGSPITYVYAYHAYWA
jgi:hypothetical protein